MADTMTRRETGACADASAAADLTAALASAARQVAGTLDALLPPVPGHEARLIEAMRYAVLNGGKRLRGFLVLETARLFGAPDERAARVAASVEMLHAYSLVHDDLPAMDDDDLRRGQPSTHRRFDEATAILAGDALQTSAFEVLADPATHPDASVRAALVLELARAAGAAGMVAGQMIDMATENRHLSAEEIARLQALKTGRLLQYAAVAGAVLGEAPAASVASIGAYGRDLGAAFQIADDVLDASGTEAEIGKTAGKDAAAGKATLVSLLGVDAARAEAERLAGRAAAHLDLFGAEAASLRALAGYVVSRRS